MPTSLENIDNFISNNIDKLMKLPINSLKPDYFIIISYVLCLLLIIV